MRQSDADQDPTRARAMFHSHAEPVQTNPEIAAEKINLHIMHFTRDQVFGCADALSALSSDT
jgi:hypothetical protein